jgi:hypothetical protein
MIPTSLLRPSDEEFAASLEPEQAAYLHAALQNVGGKKVMGLREAVMNRVLDVEDKLEMRVLAVLCFARPIEPVKAILLPKRFRK